MEEKKGIIMSIAEAQGKGGWGKAENADLQHAGVYTDTG